MASGILPWRSKEGLSAQPLIGMRTDFKYIYLNSFRCRKFEFLFWCKNCYLNERQRNGTIEMKMNKNNIFQCNGKANFQTI